jgi:cystathionine beta-lyase family protein involved in aluminum resistance
MDWKEAVNLFRNRFSYSEENINKILSIKKNINDNRTVFIWNHLNNFYNLNS